MGSRSGKGLLPYEVLEIVDRELETKKFTSECTAAYLATIRGYTTERIAHRQAEIRASWGMYEALEKEDSWDAQTDLTLGASGRCFIPSIVVWVLMQRGQRRRRRSWIIRARLLSLS